MKHSIVRVLILLALVSAAVPANAGTLGPIYPGATPATLPAGAALKTPPPSVKSYVTSDDFGKVKSWYQAHLKNALEAPQQGLEKTEDAFLVGNGSNGYVIMVRSYQGKTWILIGPPT